MEENKPTDPQGCGPCDYCKEKIAGCPDLSNEKPEPNALTCLRETVDQATEDAASGNEYMRGMANGLKVAQAVLTGEEPTFLEAAMPEVAGVANPEDFARIVRHKAFEDVSQLISTGAKLEEIVEYCSKQYDETAAIMPAAPVTVAVSGNSTVQ